jgi:hypothetical protein
VLRARLGRLAALALIVAACTGIDCEDRDEDECDSGALPVAYRFVPVTRTWETLDPSRPGRCLFPRRRA